MLIFKINSENELLEQENYAFGPGGMPSGLADQGFKKGKILPIPRLKKYQTLSERKYRSRGQYIEEYQEAVDMTIDEARTLATEELSAQFYSDILWTDEENQFYSKWKFQHSGEDEENVYDAWYGKVVRYWNESLTEKRLKKTKIGEANSLTELRRIRYNPSHTDTKESLLSPVRE